MDEIIPKLWIGDLPSALDVPALKANGIYSILSAMRGRITINETFVRHQIMLDDSPDADILVHFLPAIAFIQAELDKSRGVLVHCHAGSSRSVTIVAAYLMYTRNMDRDAALDLIRAARPCIEPNGGFLTQLAIFQQAAFTISRRDKSTRMFYVQRAACEVINGDGTLPETGMFAKYPRTPSDSAPATPGGPRRRIRCKMCRQDLATREHMLDHGEVGPATPQSSRRPSGSLPGGPVAGAGGRRGARGFGRGVWESLSMSALDGGVSAVDGGVSAVDGGVSAVDSEDEEEGEGEGRVERIEEAKRLGRRMSDAVIADGVRELVAQLDANTGLGGLRHGSMGEGAGAGGPIVANPRCSGYFLEPMKWMEPFLEGGEMAGKILCPNRKCGVKLGNYDWAGVRCGCREWVTPGFCISRSKVDEVV